MMSFVVGLGIGLCLIGLVAFVAAFVAAFVEEHSVPTEVRDRPIYAWRIFNIEMRDDGGLCLRPAFTSRSALPYIAPGACPPARDRGGGPARIAVMNSVGYHAMKDRDDLWRPIPGLNLLARVMMWGTIIEHERGYRAEFMYPDALYYNRSNRTRVQELARAYGCEIAAEPDAEPFDPRLFYMLPTRFGWASTKLPDNNTSNEENP